MAGERESTLAQNSEGMDEQTVIKNETFLHFYWMLFVHVIAL